MKYILQGRNMKDIFLEEFNLQQMAFLLRQNSMFVEDLLSLLLLSKHLLDYDTKTY